MPAVSVKAIGGRPAESQLGHDAVEVAPAVRIIAWNDDECRLRLLLLDERACAAGAADCLLDDASVSSTEQPSLGTLRLPLHNRKR
jgi:hypothetical protein